MNRKKILIGGGLVLGLLCGILPIVYAYTKVPSVPAVAELTFQLALIGICGAVGMALGFVLNLAVTVVISIVGNRASHKAEQGSGDI